MPHQNDYAEEKALTPKAQKTSITIRLDTYIVEYFKGLSEECDIPYQSLINSFLSHCVKIQKKPNLSWN